MADLTTLPRSPAEWTLDNARSVFPKPAQTVPGQGTAEGYMAGDHLQKGNAWKGTGRSSDGKISAADLGLIRHSLVAAPECADRVLTRVNGACGNEADVSIEPTEPADVDKEGNAVASKEQVSYRAAWERDFNKHWDRTNLWGGTDIQNPTGVRGVVAYGSSRAPGKGYLRVYYNPASLVSAPDGSRRIPKQPDRASALRHIEVVAPPPDRCTVYTDPDTLEKVGVFRFKDTNDKECAELWYAAEINGKRRTCLRIVREGTESDAEPQVYPLGGWIPILEADIGLLLTDPVLSLQGALDVCVTALLSLVIAHGYSARTEINAEDEGEWSPDVPPASNGPARTRVSNGVTQYFWRANAVLGNKVIRTMRGFEYTSGFDENGAEKSVGVTTPSVHYHDPSPVESLTTAGDYITFKIRDACRQGHILTGISGSTAEASGDAYEQRRAQFWADVKGVAESVGTMLVSYAVVLTLMADYLWLPEGQESDFAERWNVVVTSHPTAGPPSTEAQSTAATLVAAKIISEEEGTARVGIQDVQAERDRIRASGSLAVLAERAATAKGFIDAGADAVWAWMQVGYTEDEAKQAVRSDGPPYVEQ